MKIFIIGMKLYIFPDYPKSGDIEGLKNWKPFKFGFFKTLKFRWILREWRWATTYRIEGIVYKNISKLNC